MHEACNLKSSFQTMDYGGYHIRGLIGMVIIDTCYLKEMKCLQNDILQLREKGKIKG